MALVLPPNEVFNLPPAPLVTTQGGYGTTAWLHDICPPEGGLFAYYKNEPHPRKGHTYPEAVEANNVIKRLTIGTLMSLATPETALPAFGFFLLPWKRKVKWLNKVLSNYCRMADYINRNHYMKRQFYNQCSKELWMLTYHFLRQIGIEPDTAYGCGRIIAHLLEHDDAYRARVQDILTEISQPDLLKNPRKELVRLAEIYSSREKEGLHEKFLSIANILSRVLWVPRIRKAFTETMRAAKMENLRFDEIDRYYTLNRGGYNFSGREPEDRYAEYVKLHNEHIFRNLEKEITNPIALAELKRQLTN